MIACFLSNISAKYYKNPSMLSRVIPELLYSWESYHKIKRVIFLLRHSVHFANNNVVSWLRDKCCDESTRKVKKNKNKKQHSAVAC